MQKREGYTIRMERKLAAWQTRFETRRAQASTRDAALSAETRDRLEASKSGGDAAFAKLAELRAAAGRYAELRVEMEALWKSIDDTPPESVQLADAPVATSHGRPRRAGDV